MTEFTKQDAQTLVAIAEAAPQPNLRSAMQTVELLKRFWAWYGEQTETKTPESPPAA
jgi:hypothetical protein